MDPVVVTLRSGNRLRYLSEAAVHSNVRGRGFSDDVALNDLERSDLTRHVYEGGFKVWECSIDLCNLIEENALVFEGKAVLELGCGAGLPGILTASMKASRVVLQDFNDCVIKCFTEDNLTTNEVPTGICELVSGAWSDLTQNIAAKSFDIILTSETIYNESDYEALHDIIDYSLADSGFCWLAAKFFYFGVGGSVPSFIQYVDSRAVFTTKEVMAVDTGVPRRIIEMRRKQNYII